MKIVIDVLHITKEMKESVIRDKGKSLFSCFASSTILATLIIQRWKCRNVISHSFLTKLGQNSQDFFFCPKFIHKSFNFLICGVCDTVKQFCRKPFPPSIKIKISDRVYLNVSDCFNFLNEPSRPICLFLFV